MCDANNQEAIKKLRERKSRPSKPFAVMVKDIASAKLLAHINTDEEKLLSSQERPIVLLEAKAYTNANIIAPNISRIGLFLPYTPLHLLLLDKLGSALIATSANLSDEPIATDRKSIERLEGIYDYLLDHNREILNACDDSVVMVVEKQTIMLRRARGYTPVSVELPFSLGQKTLALGANQKSTVALGFENRAILSPHIGDLDGIASVEYFKKNIENLKRIYRFTPELLVHDKHPNYESTKYAKNASLARNEVQHHHAHILALMAEKKINSKVFGVAFDGTGYGEDGKLWGGEFMICDYEGFERVAHISYFKLLGGAKAIKEPRRVALSLLFDLYGEDALTLKNPTTKAFSQAELKTAYLMWQKGLNAPLSSSVGRLFDGVASLLGICQSMSFEGESGMRLEALYASSIKGHYSFLYNDGIININPMIKELLDEKEKSVATSKFFHTLVEMIATVYKEHQELPLLLSGGVFQNRVLLELVLKRFPHAIVPNLFPPNDGGIALGQLVAQNYLDKKA